MSIIHRFSATVLRHGLRNAGNGLAVSAASMRSNVALMPRTPSTKPVSLLGCGPRRLFTALTPNDEAIEELGTKLEALREGMSQEKLVEFLQACKIKHDFATAQQALQLARDAKLPITADIYAHVILTGTYELRLSEIRELYGEPLPQYEVGTHSPNYEQVKELLASMRSVGLELPMWFFEVLVARMYNSGQAGVVVNLIVALEKRGITPSISIYNKALHLLPRKNLVDRAEALFRKLVYRDIANYQTYTTWLSSLVATERYNEVEKLFREMSKKFTPDRIAYNILINNRLRSDNIPEALDIFDKMRSGQLPGITPDVYTLSTFIDHILATANIQYTQRIFPYLTEYGFPASSQNYALLLRFFARYDDTQFVPLLSSLMKEEKRGLRDVWIYNALLRILSDNQVLPEVKRDIAGALAEGLILGDAKTPLQEAVVNGPPGTRAVIDRLAMDGVKPDEFTYETVMRQVAIRQDNEAVERVFSLASEYKGTPSYAAHNIRLSSLLNQRLLAEAEKMLQDMRVHRVPIYPKNISSCHDLNIRLPDGILTPNGKKPTLAVPKDLATAM